MGGQGSQRAVWALDDVALTSDLSNTLMLDMAQADEGDLEERVSTNLGQTQNNFCDSPKSIV